MVTGPWGSIATFLDSRIWNFSTVLTKNKFPCGNFLNLHTVVFSQWIVLQRGTVIPKNGALKVSLNSFTIGTGNQ